MDEPGSALEIAGGIRLRKQSLYGIHALFGDDGGRHSGEGNCVRSAGGKRGWAGCASGLRGGAPAGGTGAEGRRAGFFSLQYVSLHRASRRRHQPRVLTIEAGRAGMEDEERPDQKIFTSAWTAKKLGMKET